MPLYTLFGENILSPSPSHEPQHNPLEIRFPPKVSGSASTASARSSPQHKDESLTQHAQNASQLSPQTSYTHGTQPTPSRRKGNPKVLLMGLRRSGKSSIQQVVFRKLSPADTLYLDSTDRIESVTLQSFITFESAEIPALNPLLSPGFDRDRLLPTVGAVIWVIDSQDEYLNSISELLQTAIFLTEHYPQINLAVFIHKTDGLGEEYKHDTFREVRQRVQDELSDYGHGDRSVSYYQTSIFDHSIFEAMSKVIQALLPQLPAMEALLNSLCSKCVMKKAYLFDTVSKLYIATDASPTWLRDYEACSDYVDMIVDIKQLYGWRRPSSSQRGIADPSAAINESLVTYDRSGDAYIYAREINEYLSLICVMGKESSVDQRIYNYCNADMLHDALLKIFEV